MVHLLLLRDVAKSRTRWGQSVRKDQLSCLVQVDVSPKKRIDRPSTSRKAKKRLGVLKKTRNASATPQSTSKRARRRKIRSKALRNIHQYSSHSEVIRG